MPFSRARHFLNQAEWRCAEVPTKDGSGLDDREQPRHSFGSEFRGDFLVNDMWQLECGREVRQNEGVSQRQWVSDWGSINYVIN